MPVPSSITLALHFKCENQVQIILVLMNVIHSDSSAKFLSRVSGVRLKLASIIEGFEAWNFFSRHNLEVCNKP